MLLATVVARAASGGGATTAVTVSMAGHAMPVGDAVGVVTRVGPVFTPPERRRHGYAGAVTGRALRAAARRGLARDALRRRGERDEQRRLPALGYELVDELVRASLAAATEPAVAARATLRLRPPMHDAAPDGANHEHWEALARFHGNGDDSYYDLDRLRAGGSLMGDEELAALDRATGGRGLAGLTVLHLQCHIGCDSIALARGWARRSPSVDFSRTALDRLEVLARVRRQVDAVEADATALPASLAGQFDLVYASIGVLCWIDDLDAWMQGSRGRCAPAARSCSSRSIRSSTMIESLDPLVVDFPYALRRPARLPGDRLLREPRRGRRRGRRSSTPTASARS